MKPIIKIQKILQAPTLFFGWKYVGVNFVKRIIFLGVVYVGKYYSKLPFTKSYMCVL